MRCSSAAVFDSLATSYERHFAEPHRAAYDLLAWEYVERLLPALPGRVIDAGCGVGRWVPRLLREGHEVIGIENSPGMIQRLHEAALGDHFTLVEGSMETTELAEGQADLVIAMGSLQYAERPEVTLQRFSSWLRPGGAVCVLVDSLVALVVELLARGSSVEAFDRLSTRRGVFRIEGASAEHHLFDRVRLVEAFANAGLEGIETRGLLVGATVFGRAALTRRLEASPDSALAVERDLMRESVLFDVGKQFLASGRRLT